MKTNGILKLLYLGVIKASGADAASFLNGQLSNDTLQMKEHELKLAAYCSPQGRVLASFIVLKTAPEEFLLVCSADILEETLKRLSMFVMRAKVQLTNASEDLHLYGLIEPESSTPKDLTTPTPWTYVQEKSQLWIELPHVANIQRKLIITPDIQDLPIKPTLSIDDWMCLTVRSGITTVNAKTKDLYIPQMLNYESIGVIDFQKGCYPGQEVISRSQFRGTLKRRAYIIHAQQEMQVGDEVYTASEKDLTTTSNEPQLLGSIVCAAPCADGGWGAIAVLRTEIEKSDLIFTSKILQPHEAAASLLPLPYALRDDF